MLRRTVVTLLGTLLLVGVSAGSASADPIFESGVEGIQVGGQTIGGVPGGLPWDVATGEAKIEANGDIKVEITGLVLVAPPIPADPVFPVTGVCATLVCQKTVAGDPTNEEVAVNPAANFPLSPVTGNAEIVDTLTLPAGACVAPIVLVRVSALDAGFFAGPPFAATGISVPIGCGGLGPWIAASGL